MANKNIILWLEKISEQYESDPSKNKHQKNAILKGINAIKEHNEEITSKKDAKKLKGIGNGLGDKIQVIIDTGQYPLNKKIKTETIDEQLIYKTDLMKVTGIGEKKAESLIKQGIKNKDELLLKVQQNKIKVTDHILIGLKYYDDFNERINRKEIDEFKKFFDKIFGKLKLIYEICGSYRRGASDCGDIDILVTHASFTSNESIEKLQIMSKIIEELKVSKILVEDGTLTPSAIKKFMGACKLFKNDSKSRRLDIRLAIVDSYPTSLMYFTGSKEFNLRMRSKAISLGYMLNEYGLFDGNKKPFAIKTELDIFKILDETYIEPSSR